MILFVVGVARRVHTPYMLIPCVGDVFFSAVKIPELHPLSAVSKKRSYSKKTCFPLVFRVFGTFCDLCICTIEVTAQHGGQQRRASLSVC